MADTVRRRNTTQLELTWTGTVQDFKSGVTEYIDSEALIDSEFSLDDAYLNTVDLSKTQVHKITSANLTSQSQTDPMVVSVVPARGSNSTNQHLNKLRMGSRGNNTMVLMSTRGSTMMGGDEVVYDQNEHKSASDIKIFPIEKLSSSAHTSIVPEQDGSRTVLIMSDEAVDLLEKGMETIYEQDHGTTAKMNLWEMKKR